jgi:NADH dehydrogenase [ubiquinone] 1 alpha subcomplex assembly factor 7
VRDPSPTPRPEPTPLARRLARLIRVTGPITIAQYMAEANATYYRDMTSIGAAGDFITAPEISQMFGELIGLWCATTWQAMGAPAPCALVELGPGRGTLMADARRALAALPGARDALHPWLVETSPRLRSAQAERVPDATWLDRFEQVSAGPIIVIANEFFDALPIRQFVRATAGWCERLVDATPDDTMVPVVAPQPATLPGDAAPGTVREIGAARAALAGTIAARLVEHGGAALIVDYGSGGSGDTLQAVRRHARVSPFERPGEIDLSAHVDFASLAAVARDAGATAHGPLSQAAFLGALGIQRRAARLGAAATQAQARAIQSQVERLTGADQMGSLFQAMAITHPDLPTPPGFEP